MCACWRNCSGHSNLRCSCRTESMLAVGIVAWSGILESLGLNSDDCRILCEPRGNGEYPRGFALWSSAVLSGRKNLPHRARRCTEENIEGALIRAGRGIWAESSDRAAGKHRTSRISDTCFPRPSRIAICEACGEKVETISPKTPIRLPGPQALQPGLHRGPAHAPPVRR